MAHAGQKLTNPVTGQSIVFRRTAADTGGELVEVESIYSAAGNAAPAHYHPSQDEHFEVLEGEITAVLDGEERRVGPGETLDIPAGSPHLFRKDEGAEARLLWTTRPALRTEEFMETMWGLAAEGRFDEMAAVLGEFEAEFRLAPGAGT